MGLGEEALNRTSADAWREAPPSAVTGSSCWLLVTCPLILGADFSENAGCADPESGPAFCHYAAGRSNEKRADRIIRVDSTDGLGQQPRNR